MQILHFVQDDDKEETKTTAGRRGRANPARPYNDRAERRADPSFASRVLLLRGNRGSGR